MGLYDVIGLGIGVVGILGFFWVALHYLSKSPPTKTFSEKFLENKWGSYPVYKETITYFTPKKKERPKNSGEWKPPKK